MSHCLPHSEKEEGRVAVAERLIQQRGPAGREADLRWGPGPGYPGPAAGRKKADQRWEPGHPGPAAAGRGAGPGAWPHLGVTTVMWSQC